MITFDNPGPGLAESDVADLEANLGFALPASYRQFLLDHNGGRPDPDCVDVPGFEETDVQVFFGVRRPIESSRIEWNIDTLRRRLDAGLVPIACDSGGNVFCLSLRQEDRGVVFYCDLQSVFADFETRPTVYSVATSFDSFVTAIHPFSE